MTTPWLRWKSGMQLVLPHMMPKTWPRKLATSTRMRCARKTTDSKRVTAPLQIPNKSASHSLWKKSFDRNIGALCHGGLHEYIPYTSAADRRGDPVRTLEIDCHGQWSL